MVDAEHFLLPVGKPFLKQVRQLRLISSGEIGEESRPAFRAHGCNPLQQPQPD
jgi:hypothetical protein